MAINTDLNVSPYFDDYDETKQYHRVLFKPARPVQARELTQLQTILQNQVERFGSNIYKEGTVISGCDAYQIDDLKYIKINDTISQSIENYKPRYASLDDVQSNAGVEIDDYLAFTITGVQSRLVAEIVDSADGFITRNPDLKTFFIKYKGTVDGQPASSKVFQPGEELTLTDPFGAVVNLGSSIIQTSSLDGYEGSSVGFGVTDGVIFQKGHFLYVQPQTIILSKYSNVPNDIAVGFDVEETIVNSNQDETLLDNSQGFLNKNAPGADRLKLVPLLSKYDAGDEPENFFAIGRYKAGQLVSVRDVTEFNSIERELAGRTFDQAGNYVSRGFDVGLDANEEGEVYATVSPGVAYSSGYEAKTYATTYYEIEPVTETVENDAQTTSVRYGGYLPVTSGITIPFDITGGTTYNLYNSSDTLIGSCNVQSVETGKIYIYNIRKGDGQGTEVIAKIGTSTSDAITVGSIQDVENAPAVFQIGSIGVSDVQDISFVARRRLALSGSTATTTLTIPYGPNTQPLNDGNYVVLDQTNTQVTVNTGNIITDGSGNPVSLQLTLNASITPTGSHVYYNERVSNATPDFKSQISIFVKAALDVSSGRQPRANLGVPDAYNLKSVYVWNTGAGAGLEIVEDVTTKFKLVSNQRDKYYDYSYIELNAGEQLTLDSGHVLMINVDVFQHDRTTGSGFFVANSYVNIDRDDIPGYSSSSGRFYDLSSSFDFRPSVVPTVQYSLAPAGASQSIPYSLIEKLTPTPKDLVTNTLTPPANNSTILSNNTKYLSRIDQLVVDSTGNIVLRKGKPAENPSVRSTIDLVLAEITVPGNPVKLRGLYSPKIKNTTIRAYTMKDIGDMKRQMGRLVEIATLSMLKSNADDLLVLDSAGNSRFKNGIIVDSFRNFKIADVNNPEFFAGIDKFKETLTPAMKQFPLYLKRGTQSNMSQFPEILVKGSVSTEAILTQPSATTYRNLVFGTYRYNGTGEIYPQYDGGADVTLNPVPATIDIDFETPLLGLAGQVNELLKLTGADKNVTKTDRDSTWAAGTAAGQAGQQETVKITETFDTHALDLSSTETTTQKVGEFLTNAEFKPYMESKEIKILVYGLRPNVQHYFYFEEDNVTSMVKPGGPLNAVVGKNDRASMIAGSGSFGDPVFSNAQGVLTAVFKLPAETYLVGERLLEVVDVDSYNAIDSARSSYASFKYNAYNFDYEKQALTVNTRTPTFDVIKTGEGLTSSQDIAGRFIPDPPRVNRDPLAQTFYIKRGSVNGAKHAYIDSIDVFFKAKSPTAGVLLEIREVINSYPSRQTVPFGSVHYNSKELDGSGNLVDKIKISQDGSVATTFRFDNPVRLITEREYAIVIKPDGGDPAFNVFTAKLGERNIADNKAITQDWGDGVLFSSTNNRTWVAHGDEDLKFNVNVHKFSTDASTSEFLLDDMEFFNISGTTGAFELNEIAYVKVAGTTQGAGIDPDEPTRVQTANGESVNLLIGQYAVLEQTSVGNVWASKVVDINDDELTLETPPPFSGSCDLSVGIGGIVSNFDKFRPNTLHLRKSTASAESRFVSGGTTTIYGVSSGAFAVIDTVADVEVSFVQGHMYKVDDTQTEVTFAMHNGSSAEGPLPTNNDYVFRTNRVAESKSNILGATSPQNFKVVASLNSTNEFTTPVVDDDISLLQGYKYYITNDENTTSKYVSREVTLNSDLYAEGLKVMAGIHRPETSDVKCYARFKYKDNVEELSAWKLLENQSPELYSNRDSLSDFREFDFVLPEDQEKEFISFQLKFVMTSTSYTNVPRMIDYRAIAVT